ncbi:MAG: TonB-dependent receptor [Planctomycetes bacterium]|nr:TonB-dependent receptor [Planctomycetota bacterium]
MKSIATVVLTLFLLCPAVGAQEGGEDLKKENQELKRQIEELKKKLAEKEGAAPLAPAAPAAPAAPTIAPAAGDAPAAPATKPAEAPPAAPTQPRAAASPEKKPTPREGPREETLLGEVVVTATRSEASLRTLGSAISTVTGAELRQQAAFEAVEPLRSVPGLSIKRVGGRGEGVIVTTRGLANVHTLFQLEGFELNSDGGVMLTLDTLQTDGLSGIEVLRGAQSGLYGGNASAGVVNFRLARGEGPPRGRVSFEYGSFNTQRERLAVQGGDATFGYSLAASRLLQTDGPIDDEDLEVNSVLGRFDYNLSDRTRILAIVHARGDEAEFVQGDAGARTAVDFDTDNVGQKDILVLGLDIGHWLTDWWDAHLQLERFTLGQNSFDGPVADPFGDRQFEQQYAKGIAHLSNRLYPCKWNAVTVGVEFEKQDSAQIDISDFPAPDTATARKDEASTTSFYFQDEVNAWDTVFLTASLRRDDFESFGEKWTYRLAGAFRIERTNTKLRASTGSGVAEPQFFQLFTPGSGNPDLQPERNRAWDAGFDQWLLEDKLRFSATYFQNKLRDAIRFRVLAVPPFFQAQNSGDADIQGVELETQWDVARDLLLQDDAVAFHASYTWTDTEVVDTADPDNIGFKLGASLLDVPRGEANFNIHYGVADQWGLNLDVNYVGRRKTIDFATFTRGVEDEHGKLDIAAFYRLPWLKGLKAIVRGENVTDEDYDEATGFPAPGANVLGGLEYELRF